MYILMKKILSTQVFVSLVSHGEHFIKKTRNDTKHDFKKQQIEMWSYFSGGLVTKVVYKVIDQCMPTKQSSTS